MPRATVKNTTGVSLELSDAQPSYLPGDIITGYVVWNSTSIGFVRLRLFGRVKTKIKREGTPFTRSSLTRGRVVLFNATDILFSGPPCQTGEQARPFSVTIPTTAEKVVAAGKWRESQNFVSITDDTTKLPLPFSYYYNAADMGVDAEGFVEYVLQVETAVTLEASKYESSLGITSLPLVLRPPLTAVPSTAQTMSVNRLAYNIVTNVLGQNFDETKMTFRQKMKKAFNASSKPRYMFWLRVEAPTRIQLDDPEPVPFRISVQPNLEPEFTNICLDGDTSKLPEVRCTSLKIFLRSTTLVRCPSAITNDISDKEHRYYWSFIDPIDVAIPLTSISHGQDPISSQPETLDLGGLLNLRLTRFHTDAQGALSAELERPLWPSFRTFSINVSYDLMYEIEVECAGEKLAMRTSEYARSRVEILLPAKDNAKFDAGSRKKEFDGHGLGMIAGSLAYNIASNFW